MKKYYLIGFALLTAAFIGGCILSGTVTFTYEIAGGINSDTAADTVHVDLSTESDYNDNKDKIKSVDALSIVGQLVNNGDDTNSAVIYMQDTVDTIRVFTSPRVAPHDTIMIDWSDGMAHIQNFDALVEQIKGDGVFDLIGQAENSPFNMDFAATLVITFTVGN